MGAKKWAILIGKYLWAAPTTAVGIPLLLATLITGGKARWYRGVLEIHGGASAWYLRKIVGLFIPGGASAITFGHIVIARDQQLLDLTREHERVHVAQCQRWGPAFIPAYLLCSAWLLMRGKNAYRDNPFEKEAYEVG